MTATVLINRIDAGEQVRRRAVQDAISDALAWRSHRRADEFDAAAHRPGIDFPGRATVAELDAQKDRCTAISAALRGRAELLLTGALDEPWAGFWADLDAVAQERAVTSHVA